MTVTPAITKAARLRELFARPGIIRAIGAHNALGAKLAERAGFDAIWSSGLEISTSHGVPDANILTMSEFLAAGESMDDAVSLPIIADCDTGFGNSNNVIRMVQKFEAGGVAAVCIEDKHFPKVNSFVAGRQELAPIAEFVGKILAAKNAQMSREFMVIARVEALIAGAGQQEAMRRARAYVGAGADAILIHSKLSCPDEILEFVRSWDEATPLVVVPTTYHSITADELESVGVKVVIYANHGLRASIRAMEETLREILTTGSSSQIEDSIAPMSLVFDLQGMPKMKQEEKAFLRSGQLPTRAVVPAAGDHLDEYSMKDISEEIPMTMLDVNGKPMLQRQVEALNKVGVSDVTVVGGYRADRISVDGVNLVVNRNWARTGLAASILSADSDYGGRTLTVFSDVLFDSELVGRLLQSQDDITLVVSRDLDEDLVELSRALDLVTVADPSPRGRRILDTHSLTSIISIGKTLHPLEAHCVYTGLALFSEKGWRIFREVYEQARSRDTDEAFQEATSVERASFTDVIQEIIDSGHPVYALQTSKGWMEIHSFDDYREACAQLARR